MPKIMTIRGMLKFNPGSNSGPLIKVALSHQFCQGVSISIGDFLFGGWKKSKHIPTKWRQIDQEKQSF